MITIKYSVTVSNDDPILSDLEKNAEDNEWWVGSSSKETVFTKAFPVERKNDVSVLSLLSTERDMGF